MNVRDAVSTRKQPPIPPIPLTASRYPYWTVKSIIVTSEKYLMLNMRPLLLDDELNPIV
jgi:hypothetical protein